jgi:hypothetical protein
VLSLLLRPVKERQGSMQPRKPKRVRQKPTPT